LFSKFQFTNFFSNKFQDPEHGINKKGVADTHHQGGIGPAGFASVGSLAYSSIFPTTAVMINWHDQGRLTRIKESVKLTQFILKFCFYFGNQYFW
jgi:hypothetical protein